MELSKFQKLQPSSIVSLLPISTLLNKGIIYRDNVHERYASTDDTGTIFIDCDMVQFFGKKVTIVNIIEDGYCTIKESGKGWVFMHRWFDDEENDAKDKIKLPFDELFNGKFEPILSEENKKLEG